MKIVFFTHYLKGGGAERRCAVFANYFFEHGYDVEIVTMHHVDNEYEINKDIPRHYIAKDYKEYSSLSKKQRLNKLETVLKEIKPTHIFSFLTTYAFYVALLTKVLKRIPNVKTIYPITLYQRKYSLFSRFIDFCNTLFSDVILLQCGEQIKCNKWFKKKCIVCYNPIDRSWKNKQERVFDSLKIISVGRLTSQKNYPLTIKAVVNAHKANKNISLDIYGSGVLENKLNKLISKHKAESYIKIHPFTFNLKDEFASHNVYVSSSKFEGFPNSLAEAMYSGLLSYSTPCPTGPKEIINHGQNGFLFKNSKDLTNQLLDIGNKKNEYKKVAINGRDTINTRFRTDIVLSKLEKELFSK